MTPGRRSKVTGDVLTLDKSLEDALPYLFALLGIVESEDRLAQIDAQVKKRRTLDAIKRILLRESLNQPLIVIFEDACTSHPKAIQDQREPSMSVNRCADLIRRETT